MFILDTNIISELMKDKLNPFVEAWFQHQNENLIFMTSITVLEIKYGLYLLNEGRKKEVLKKAFEHVAQNLLRDKILNFTPVSAELAARLMVQRHQSGFYLEWRDAQIAGIVLEKEATLVTRNTKDFITCGLQLQNPF